MGCDNIEGVVAPGAPMLTNTGAWPALVNIGQLGAIADADTCSDGKHTGTLLPQVEFFTTQPFQCNATVVLKESSVLVGSVKQARRAAS